MALGNLCIEIFGQMPYSVPVYLFTLKNTNGMRVQLTNYGARIVSSQVPDRAGSFDEVVLGYTCLDQYLKGHQYLGATIGRVTNRIGNGRFDLDGQTYFLPKNLGNHHLHGGNIGFESNLWDVVNYNDEVIPWVEFQLTSSHGDQGYPGNLISKVRYSLNGDNSIEINLSAISDRSTIVNLTNHAYFNLSGALDDNIYKHQAQFYASNFLKVDRDLVPNGDIQKVEGTVMDFRQPSEVGLGINQKVDPVEKTKGYDQFLIADSYLKGEVQKMAEIYEPESGRVLEVASTLPGFQFYTSNFLDTEFPAINGKICRRHSSLCIEPSYFVDAPNHPNFQSIQLDRGDIYNETIIYKFSTR